VRGERLCPDELAGSVAAVKASRGDQCHQQVVVGLEAYSELEKGLVRQPKGRLATDRLGSDFSRSDGDCSDQV
jgi:hypothetical protein